MTGTHERTTITRDEAESIIDNGTDFILFYSGGIRDFTAHRCRIALDNGATLRHDGDGQYTLCMRDDKRVRFFTH